MAFVDQPGSQRLRREVRATDGDVVLRIGLQRADEARIERSLDARSSARYRSQRCLEHDLLGRSPDLRVVRDVTRLIGRVRRLPVDHCFIHSASVDVRADGPFEVVDESMD